ncbi:MAG: YitT family protein [Bacilli bacterium]|nr:YitT family protein [Bacilli bacterium]
MNEIKKYIKIIIGTLLISLGFNIFIVPSKLIPSGMLGLTSLLSFNYGFNNAALLLIINVWTLWLIYMLYDSNKLKEYLLPSILLPIFIYITSFIKINITNSIEELLIAISGSFIMGVGYSILYKEGFKTGAINILEDIYNDLAKKNIKTISRGLDIILILITLKIYGLEHTIYSIIVILIIRYMTTKAKIGISDSKAFYIITTKEKEIKKYLLEELNYDLTTFDAEGGFTKKKKQIIMSVISSKDYFKVKEGINLIDPKAFISVTDNYEVINENVEINED